MARLCHSCVEFQPVDAQQIEQQLRRGQKRLNKWKVWNINQDNARSRYRINQSSAGERTEDPRYRRERPELNDNGDRGALRLRAGRAEKQRKYKKQTNQQLETTTSCH